MAKNTRNTYGLGKSSPLINMATLPIKARRNPLTNDLNYEIGSMWFNTTSNRVWILTSISNNEAYWGSIALFVEGAAATTGTVRLLGGSASHNTTAVTSISRIFLTPQAAIAGVVYISAIVPGVSFTVTSTNGADSNDVAWLIIEPN